nr:coat protein [Daphne virus S]
MSPKPDPQSSEEQNAAAIAKALEEERLALERAEAARTAQQPRPASGNQNRDHRRAVGVPREGDDERIEQRLDALRQMLRAERGNISVTNASFERGRPALTPTPDMRGDPSNPYSRPSTDLLWSIKPKPRSDNMATSEDIMRISTQLEGLGVPTEHVSKVILQAVFYCADKSSSSYQDPQGTFEFPGGAIMVDDVVGTINSICTLRKVCRLYAAVVWNYMHIHDKPPADWRAMGFNYNTRYAAFDFFDYVENEAAIKPAGGIVPRPTDAEYIAFHTYKQLALDRANNNATYANLDVAVTGGRTGPLIERNLNNANNRKQ